MAIYTLNIAQWRCGDEGEHQLGIGDTKMLNREGFSCCLGQFAKPKVSITSLRGIDTPAGVAYKENRIYDPVFVELHKSGLCESNTKLAIMLMEINDDEYSTVKEKIQCIRDVLKQYGHQLRVINQHLIPK